MELTKHKIYPWPETRWGGLRVNTEACALNGQDFGMPLFSTIYLYGTNQSCVLIYWEIATHHTN